MLYFTEIQYCTLPVSGQDIMDRREPDGLQFVWICDFDGLAPLGRCQGRRGFFGKEYCYCKQIRGESLVQNMNILKKIVNDQYRKT